MRKITIAERILAAPFASLLCIITLVACDPAINAVRIEPGSVPLHPLFILTDTSGRGSSGTIYGISVVRCGTDSAIWQLAANGAKSAPSRLTYGETPEGFVTLNGPETLRPGCYDVFVTNSRRARFRVDAQGRIVAERVSRPDSAARP